MYGDNYGYRSGLNSSMRKHLQQTASLATSFVLEGERNVVLDIGSNDGTLLRAFEGSFHQRLGIDPTAEKFEGFYDSRARVVADFFSSNVYWQASETPANLVTSISMFYDLEDPVGFARDVAETLAPGGVWFLEQSYLPLMLQTLSYDTICHEHVEYYSIQSLRFVLESAGLQIRRVRTNSVNGGSFSVVATRVGERLDLMDPLLPWFLAVESSLELDKQETFEKFDKAVRHHRDDLRALIERVRSDGRVVWGLGASTKGNVLLQYASLTSNDIRAIGDINDYKWGRRTPGTNIPIVSEEEMFNAKPDYILVLPWHFRSGIVASSGEWIRGGGQLIFPLPRIELLEEAN